MHVHTHPAGELLPGAWKSLDELLRHMSEGHFMLIGPVGKTIGSLARIHAGEHEEAAMTTHPQVFLVPPGEDEPVGIDAGLVLLVTALWAAGFTTITCCQDLGESIGAVNARKAAYWKGWVLLELPVADAKRLTEQAAARGFPVHWATPGAWEISVPVVMLGSRAIFTGIVQVRFPAAQLDDLTAMVQGLRGR
jgi:hypothetical protein